MNWHDGLTLIWHLCSCGFNPWGTQIKHFFWLFLTLA